MARRSKACSQRRANRAVQAACWLRACVERTSACPRRDRVRQACRPRCATRSRGAPFTTVGSARKARARATAIRQAQLQSLLIKGMIGDDAEGEREGGQATKAETARKAESRQPAESDIQRIGDHCREDVQQVQEEDGKSDRKGQAERASGGERRSHSGASTAAVGLRNTKGAHAATNAE